jgi:hypothetical protein
MGVNFKTDPQSQRASLCYTCTHAHVERGFRESEELVICRATWPEHRVPFHVRECSSHVEAQRQTLLEMERIAWVVVPQGGKRTAGFAAADDASENEHEFKIILNDPD